MRKSTAPFTGSLLANRAGSKQSRTYRVKIPKSEIASNNNVRQNETANQEIHGPELCAFYAEKTGN